MARAFSSTSQADCASAREGGPARVLLRKSIATPQCAIAQVGSCCKTPSKVLRAYPNQYECSMATPRSNSACTFGSQEVGKLNLPSFSSCWANALPVSKATMMLAEISRHFDLMVELPILRRADTPGCSCSA